MSKKEIPKIGLAVIVMKNDRILLGKRKNSHGEGTWQFPGGHLEFYEKFEDCALRETREETGIIIELIDKNPATLTNDFFVQEEKHYVTLYMRAKYVAGEPKVREPKKCERWDWFEWNNLPKPLFLPIENLLKQGYNPFE